MYLRARKSRRIKTGKPQPKESPSKTPITYERGIPRSSTWKGKAVLQDRNLELQEAKTVLKETFSKLEETQKLEERIE